MRDVAINRLAHQRLAAAGLGLSIATPYTFAAHQVAVRHASEIASLPADPTSSTKSLQFTDPASPYFGLPKFLAGYDAVGSTPIG